MTEVLSIRGLSKTFPGQRALIDVDFDVEAGQVHALVGQNGSGKSTLIKCLAGYHEPDPGAQATYYRYSLPGDPDVAERTEFRLGDSHAAEAAGIRFVHQDLALVETLGAIENLAIGSGYSTTRTGTIRWREQRRRTQQELADLGYQFDVRTPVSELAPAERTGIAIARALHDWQNSVNLLVLDEPTAALPGPDVERLFEVIRTVSDRGVAVVYVSHHLDEVFEIADVVTVLRDGKKVADAPIGELDHERLVELIVGQALAEEFSQVLHDHDVDGEAVIETNGLRGSTLLNLDLRLARGEVVGIAGITGSGREEVARLIFGGLDREGEVRVEGQLVPRQRPDKSMAAGVALVPAERKSLGIVPEMVVRENVTLTGLSEFFNQGLLRRRAERSNVRGWLDELDVRPRMPEREMKDLSGGNQQKAVLAKWLRLEPKLLILDEPTQGVDVGAKADIHRLIDDAAEKGMAVLVCSTDTDELVRLCNRVVVLQRGHEIAQVTGEDMTNERLEQLQLQVSQVATA